MSEISKLPIETVTVIQNIVHVMGSMIMNSLIIVTVRNTIFNRQKLFLFTFKRVPQGPSHDLFQL